LIGLSSIPIRKGHSFVTIGAILLTIGAMGSVGDAMIHALAYEMTERGADPTALLPVMTRMQGPELTLLAPLLLCFLVGSLLLAIAFARQGWISAANPWLFGAAILVGLIGSRLTVANPSAQRVIGLTALALISLSQAWIGLAIARMANASDHAVNRLTSQS
jgi:hypothetical protein